MNHFSAICDSYIPNNLSFEVFISTDIVQVYISLFEISIKFSCVLGGVYMKKLAPVRVSYRHDFLILYRVYMMTGLFHISLLEGTLHVDKCKCDSKWRTLCMRYPFQSTSRPISHRNGWSFRVYMIPLRDFVPE